MKKLIFLTFLSLIATTSICQTTNGLVFDKDTKEALAGATIQVPGTAIVTSSNHLGEFKIKNITGDSLLIVASYVGYKTAELHLNVKDTSTKIVELQKDPVMTGLVTVSSTRVRTGSPMTFVDISKKEIEKINTGRDIPFLLENTPSVVTTSDAGTGIGYTGIRIRGSDPTRINVTINGIPINDAESQGMYWVDMPDLASSVEDIQVQRGVGTSTNGAGAFGGSINIQTSDPEDKAYAESGNTVGSFNTIINNLKFGTGILNKHWKFETRLSRMESDGYIDRASADMRSLYFSGGYYGEKDILKIVVLSGVETTYQSWYGVPEASLDTNRTWNYYTYENQVDHYQQDHYQLFYSKKLSENTTLNTALHYTYGRGYFEEFQTGQDLAEYSIPYPVIGTDTITSSDLVRRKWLDNDFYGITASLNSKINSNVELIIGSAWNNYSGDHFGKVIWSQYASTIATDHTYYDYNGSKTDINAFAKGIFKLNSSISLFADLQIRNINYNFSGLDDMGNDLPMTDDLLFFNPKAGVTMNLNNGMSTYISFATANKEPSSDDYTESTPNSRPKHEQLYNLEAGIRHTTSKLSGGLNFYFMNYIDQLVLTGQVNDVGNYTRVNIEKSYRAGMELDATYQLSSVIRLSGNITLSENKIKEFNEFTDNYDTGIQEVNSFNNTDIAFSPSTIGSFTIGVLPLSNFETALSMKYVGDQYLDNTSNENKKLNGYSTVNLVLNYTIKPNFMKQILLTGMVNNILDEKYESNGYTFSYIYGGEKTSENYYYPQAGINFLAKVTFKF